MNTHILPYFGDMPIEDIRYKNVTDFIETLSCSSKRINNILVPIQTRHTFATMMITAGEDIGWVQNMLGHSSLQMLFNHYYAWIPRETRTDGSAFMTSVMKKSEDDNKEINLAKKIQESQGGTKQQKEVV